MIQTKLIKKVDKESFDAELNEFLKNLLNHQLIDIKFNCVMHSNTMVYSALVVYNVLPRS